jgi:hypothetical protein
MHPDALPGFMCCKNVEYRPPAEQPDGPCTHMLCKKPKNEHFLVRTLRPSPGQD